MTNYVGQASDVMRAARLQKARDRELEESSFKKRKLENELKVGSMETKFAAHAFDAVESEIKATTVGLLTIDQMKQTQERALMEREKQLARREKEKRKEERDRLKKKTERKLQEKKQIKSLSFNPDDDEEDDEEENISDQEDRTKSPDSDCVSPDAGQRKRFGMNPDVDTTFLPDRDRDEQENEMREKLRLEWEQRQKLIKEEEIEITYSYWDGSGHRKNITMKKGNSIYQFLVKVLEAIRSEFPELKTVTADQLMYVKEDLIIPQTNTFYDFIVSRARGKSGPLFSFDAHEDVRMISDATIEKDESHAGKVVLRNWYERNKHIFPASRWEPYDPTKTYEKYSVADSQANDTNKSKIHEGSNFMSAKPKESEDENVLKKLTMGSQSGCRSQCKCSKSVVCEMHYQAKSRF